MKFPYIKIAFSAAIGAGVIAAALHRPGPAKESAPPVPERHEPETPAPVKTAPSNPSFGMGIKFIRTGEGAQITTLLKDGPAMKAGLAGGDVLINLGTVYAPAATEQTLTSMLSGKDTPRLTITYKKSGADAQYEITLQAAPLDPDGDYVTAPRAAATPVNRQEKPAYVPPGVKMRPQVYTVIADDTAIRETPSRDGAFAGLAAKDSCVSVFDANAANDHVMVRGVQPNGVPVEGYVLSSGLSPLRTPPAACTLTLE